MKQWMQRCAACLVAILCAVFVPGRALALETPAEARSGVVRVIVEMQTDLYSLETGEPVGTLQGYSSGSAFGVGAAGEETDIFVTNRHVVTLSEGEESGTMEVNGAPVYFERSITSYYVLLDNFAYNSQSFELDSSRAVPFRVIYVGEEDDADVAVLQTAEPVEGRIALALLEEEDSLQVGDDVNALGYPAISDNATSEGFLLATVEDVTLTDGTVSRFFDSVSVTAEEGLLSGHLIQSTATINAGNSGGPLVNDQGVVVGINTNTISSTDTSVSSAYYALQIRYAREALDSLEIPYDTDATQSQEPLASSLEETAASQPGDGMEGNGNPNRVWIVFLILGAVVAAGVVAVLVAASRRSKSSPAPTQPKGAEETPSPGPAPGPVPQPAAEGDSGFRIQGVSGALEGKRFLLPAGSPVTIGRDPKQCGVVFPPNTPGVSSKHCAVWVDPRHVFVPGKQAGPWPSHGPCPRGELLAGQPPGELCDSGEEMSPACLRIFAPIAWRRSQRVWTSAPNAAGRSMGAHSPTSSPSEPC